MSLKQGVESGSFCFFAFCFFVFIFSSNFFIMATYYQVDFSKLIAQRVQIFLSKDFARS